MMGNNMKFLLLLMGAGLILFGCTATYDGYCAVLEKGRMGNSERGWYPAFKIHCEKNINDLEEYFNERETKEDE